MSLKLTNSASFLKIQKVRLFETVSNDASGNVKFSKLEFKKGQEGVHNYTVEEVKGSDATVTYDTMKANVTVTVKHDGTAKVLIATVGDIADKEFNNRVTPPEEPKFQPEKYVVSKENSISLVTNSLMMIKSWQTSTQTQMRTHTLTMHQITKRKLEH